MFQNSLVYHYLCYATSQNKHLKQRLVFLVSVILVCFYFIDSAAKTAYPQPQLGLEVFSTITGIMMFLIVLFIPMSLSQTIESEKKNGTLPLLTITEYSIGKVIWQRYLSFLLLFKLHLLGSLPIFLLCVVMGGISAEQILAVYGVVIVTLIFTSSASFFLSFLIRNISPIVALFIFGILSIFLIIFADESDLSFLSVFDMYYHAMDGKINSYDYTIFFVGHILLSLVLIKFSVYFAKKIVYYEPKMKWKDRILLSIFPSWQRTTRIVKKRRKEFYLNDYLFQLAQKKRTYRIVRKMCWIAAIICVVFCISNLSSSRRIREEVVFVSAFFFPMFYFFVCFCYICLSSPFDKSFELLLLTGLKPSNMVDQYAKAAWSHIKVFSLGYVSIFILSSNGQWLFVFVIFLLFYILTGFHSATNIAIYNVIKYRSFNKSFFAGLINIGLEWFVNYIVILIIASFVIGIIATILPVLAIIILFIVFIVIPVRLQKIGNKYREKAIVELEKSFI